jgi:multiple antibiotic resistance protein
MSSFSYQLTIFFLLLGPIKIILPFARLLEGAEPSRRKRAAVYGTLFAAGLCLVIGLLARVFAGNFHLGVTALRFTSGLILLMWALNAIFSPGRQDVSPSSASQRVGSLALSPLATPIIITPAGVAAVMIFVLLPPQERGGYGSLGGALALVMSLNFLVMYFNDRIVKFPGILAVLQILGSVLVVVQVAFAIQVILNALEALGVIPGSDS